MIEEASPQRAARALLAYIRKHFGTIPAFCEAAGLDRHKVQNAINGKAKRIDVAFAMAIEEATSGAVKAAWWAEPVEKVAG